MPDERSERHQARLAVVEEKIRSGEIADPETLEKPTAAEISAALLHLNRRIGNQQEAHDLLAGVRDYVLTQNENGQYVLVRGVDNVPGVFAPPTALVERVEG